MWESLFVEGLLSIRAFSSDEHVSSRMNTIMSRDQFKPIRLGENLVLNCRPDIDLTAGQSNFVE